MNVKEVLAQKDSLFGKEVTVDGFLVEKAPERHLYLAPDDENRDVVSNSIRIILTLSRQELHNRLPTFVGSEYAYSDPATATGILQSSNDDVFPAVITRLTKFTSMQGDEEIDVLSEG